jgi:hypothetical protein
MTATLLLTPCFGQEADTANESAAALKRVTHDIEYMASDEMGGRKPGTPGIKLCEEFLVEEYKKAGLKPLEDGTYFQELEVGGTRKVLADASKLVFTGPNDQSIELEFGKDYQQLLGLRKFDLNAEVVFVGYGISAAEDHNYDDYADVDVEGKIVVLIRREPQNTDPESVFDGEDLSRHASGRRKTIAARRAKAAGILMVNDGPTTETEGDELMQSSRFGSNSIPFAHIKRASLDKLLKVSPIVSPLGKKLDNIADVEKLIDSNLEPLSQSLGEWKAEFKSEFELKQIKTNNIIGIIEGEGPHADETIVIGAHYDHLGMGGPGSRAGGRREIHNGADDNATGTAAILELARRFNQRDKKPGRRLVFICFTAEEMGLLGARYYVENPIYPIENTVAMVNFDMIGWLRDNTLTLYNWSTSPQFNEIFANANEGIDFELKKPTMNFGGSDHLPFNAREVPNMFIHTGTNSVYHTPEDDFEAINCEGALKVIDYSESVVSQLAELDERPSFGAPKPFRLGVMIEQADDGLLVSGVTSDSVAERAGILKGDIILEADGDEMKARRNLTRKIQSKVGSTMKLKLKRDDTEMNLNVTLKKK